MTTCYKNKKAVCIRQMAKYSELEKKNPLIVQCSTKSVICNRKRAKEVLHIRPRTNLSVLNLNNVSGKGRIFCGYFYFVS